TDCTFRLRRPLGSPGRWSSFTTTETRGATCAIVSTHSLMTAMTSSHSPSMLVNMALVSLGRPLARTMRTASATRSPTDSSVPSGVMENAAIMLDIVPLPDPNSHGRAGDGPWLPFADRSLRANCPLQLGDHGDSNKSFRGIPSHEASP